MCLHSLAYLLIIRLQDMVEPGDLSQFAQFSLHTLQGCGQLLLLWRVQLLQEGTHKYEINHICMSNTMLHEAEELKVELCLRTVNTISDLDDYTDTLVCITPVELHHFSRVQTAIQNTDF